MKAKELFFILICMILFCLAMWSAGITLIVWLLRLFGVNI